MRDNYISELIKEIRGPRNGSNEILSSNPYSEYITGVIIPRNCNLPEPSPDAEQVKPESELLFREDSENESDYSFLIPSELDPQSKPKSFGISFLINGTRREFDVCVSWARCE